jgi:hypothetical protein
VPADHQLPKSVLKELQATDAAKYVVETGKESYPWPAEVWYRIQGPDPSRMQWETAPHRQPLFATIGHVAYIAAGNCYEHGPLSPEDFEDGVRWAIPQPPAAGTYSYSASGNTVARHQPSLPGGYPREHHPAARCRRGVASFHTARRKR